MHAIVSRRSRRVLFGATRLRAFALRKLAPAGGARREDGDQAEWPQSYEASPQMAVGREATPILSPATVAATEAAIQKYQDIVARGGWGTVPPGRRLRIGSKGPARCRRSRPAGRVRRSRPIAGQGPIYNSFVEAAVKRFQARHGLGADRRRQRGDASPNSTSPPQRGCSSSRPISCG